jgi:hypothetical protein
VGGDCFTGFCNPGFYCNSAYICTAYRQEGDLCNISSDCLTGLECVQNGTQRLCQSSTTLGKTCGWNSLGQHNCTVGFGESCVCFDSSTPRCVDVTSQEYLGRILQSQQILTTSSAENVQLLNNATLSASVCQLASLNLDTAYASALPSLMVGSYLMNKTGCNFANSVPTFDNALCRSQYAKYLCCSLCSGLLDAELSQYPNLNRDDKIFSGLYLGPIYTLTCGANPSITVNLDTCNGPNVLSYNDIINQLQCGSSFQPSYGLMSFNVSMYNPSSLSEVYLEALILNFVISLGLPQPSVVSVTERSDNPYLNFVMIGFSGASNTQQTLSTLSNSFSGSNFTNYLTQYNVAGASISQVLTANIVAPIFNQTTPQPFPSNQTTQPFPINQTSQPLPNNPTSQPTTQPHPNNQSPQPSTQPLPNNLSPQPHLNPQSVSLPSTQPLPNNLSPQPLPLIPIAPKPLASTPTNTPTSTPSSPFPTNTPTSPSTPSTPSFAAKSVVVSMIILIASMVIGISF